MLLKGKLGRFYFELPFINLIEQFAFSENYTKYGMQNC